MPGLESALEAILYDEEDVWFNLIVDDVERVVGTGSRLIIGEENSDAVDITVVQGSEIVSYSVESEVEKRGIVKRLLGKTAEVQEFHIDTKADSVSFRVPREWADEVQMQITALVASEVEE